MRKNPASTRTPTGEVLTGLVLTLFRLNNGLLAAGDRLVEGLGLTSARWQVLGAIVEAGRPQPVAWLARDLGANRQNVQRIINDLQAAGIVAFQDNPHHRRAQLVVLTEQGRRIYESAMRLQAPWIRELAEGISAADARLAHQVLLRVLGNLDRQQDA